MINTPQPTEPRSPLTTPLTVPKQPSNVPVYVAFIFGVMLIGLASIVTITIVRPNTDNAALYVTVIGFLTSTLTAGLAFIKSQEAATGSAINGSTLQDIHLSINSRFDKFADEIKKASHAEGVKEESDRLGAAGPTPGQQATTEASDNLARLIKENTRITQEIHNEQVRLGHVVAPVVPLIAAALPHLLAPASAPSGNAGEQEPVPVETRTEAEERKGEGHGT